MTYTLTEVRGPVGIVVLNNPARRNALSKPLVDELMAALADFARRKLRVAVLRAPPGATVFSAGHDVEELPRSRRDPLGWDDPLRYLIREIENFPAPVIAMLEGGVWGGACEAVFACDLIVAAPDVTFAITPAKLGVPYNLSGMVTFLNAAPLHIVHEMAFTAKPISAERAERLGMINNVVVRHHQQPPVEPTPSRDTAVGARLRATRATRPLPASAPAVGEDNAASGQPHDPDRGPPVHPHELPPLLNGQDRPMWVDVPCCDAAATTVLTNVMGFHPMPTRDRVERTRSSSAWGPADHPVGGRRGAGRPRDHRGPVGRCIGRRCRSAPGLPASPNRCAGPAGRAWLPGVWLGPSRRQHTLTAVLDRAGLARLIRRGAQLRINMIFFSGVCRRARSHGRIFASAEPTRGPHPCP